MRAILIDAENRTITEIDVKTPNKSFDEFYKIIGCDLVEFVDLDKQVTMIIDECCKLKEFSGGFKFFGIDDIVITGKAIVIGMNNGKFTALKEHIKTFKLIVEWIGKDDVPDPEFKIYSW